MQRIRQAVAITAAFTLCAPVMSQDPVPAAEALPPQDETSLQVECAVPPPPEGSAQAGGKGSHNDGLAKDVGSATGSTAGQIAGASVAGPIGAAAGGVVVERVGRAIGSLVKGNGEKKRQRRTAQRQAEDEAATRCEVPLTEPTARQPQ